MKSFFKLTFGSLHSSWPALAVAVAVFGVLATAAPAADGSTASGLRTSPRDQIEVRALPFDLNAVRLLDGPFRQAMLRDLEYLRSLDSARLLHCFRVNAGLASSARALGGWEGPEVEVRGHSLGHFLSACALIYASTGDEPVKTKADNVVAELARCQAALPARGFHPGYLAAFPESFFDRVDKREPVWVPWYTCHKIMAGLLDMYQYCSNQQALDVLVKMADWVKFRVDRLSVEQMQAALETEHGGMNEVLANLYAVSGNPEHLRLARAFDHRRVFDPLARGEDRLDGLHANTQIPKITGAAREYELTGEQRYHDIAKCFWENVALHRSYVIGGHSDSEHFFPRDQFALHLSPETCETCNTYNLLKLTRHLFQWSPRAATMDFYERALYNHILASQDPEQGMFAYFISLKPGHFKVYSTPEDSFWCCVGTGMENHAKYGDTIFFRDADSLYVNLFIAAELNWKEQGLVVRQETTFPRSDTARLTLRCDKPVVLTLKIRHPGWAKALQLRVNGRKQSLDSVPGSYASIRREWRDGDRVEFRLPMELRAEVLPGDPQTVAILYGPLVLAGELGKEGLPSPYARNQNELNNNPSPAVPVFVTNENALLSHIKPVHGGRDGILRFRTAKLGQPRDITLIPFYELHRQRYSVYWKLFSREAWAAEQVKIAAAEKSRQELDRRTVDLVHIGETQSETDHGLRGDQTQSGALRDRKWRHAVNGGWFSYELKVQPGQPLELLCDFWGSDTGGRVFDILIDGQKIATQKLDNNQPTRFFDQPYSIPPELTQGKERVTVKFQAQPGCFAGGLFGLRMIREAK